MSIAELNTYRSAAIAALVSGDFDAAILNAEAMLLLVVAPDVAQGTGGGSNRSIEMPNGEAVESFINRMKQRRKAAAVSSGGSSGGIFAQSRIINQRPTG